MGYLKYSKANSKIVTSDGNPISFIDTSLMTLVNIDTQTIDIYINNDVNPITLYQGGYKILKDININSVQILPIGSRCVLYVNTEAHPKEIADNVDIVARNLANQALQNIGTETFTQSNFITDINSVKKNIDNLDIALKNAESNMSAYGMKARKELFQTFTPNGTVNYQLSRNDNGNIISRIDGSIIPFDISHVILSEPYDISNLSGGAIYNSNNIFTRKRVSVTNIDALGNITLDYVPNQDFRIYYVFELQSNMEMDEYYYKSDYLNIKEMEIGQLTASNVVFDNVGTGLTSTEVQSAIKEQDLNLSTHESDTIVHLTQTQNEALDNANAPTINNPFATLADLVGVSGTIHPIVSDLTTLSNIIVNDRVDKMLVPVDSNQYFYKYDISSVAIADGVNIIAPFDNNGRYIKFMSSATAHNLLGQIQGGNGTNEYYHLTADDYNKRVTTDNAVSFSNKAIILHSGDNNSISGILISDISNLQSILDNKAEISSLVNYARLDIDNNFLGVNNFVDLKLNNIDVVNLSALQDLLNKTIDGTKNTIINIPQSSVTNLTNDLFNINTNIASVNTDLNNFESNFDLAGKSVNQILTVDTDGIIRAKSNLSGSGSDFTYILDNDIQLTQLTPVEDETVFIRDYNLTGIPNIGIYHNSNWVFINGANGYMPISVYDTDNDGVVDRAKESDSVLYTGVIGVPAFVTQTDINNSIVNKFDMTINTSDDVPQGTNNLYMTLVEKNKLSDLVNGINIHSEINSASDFPSTVGLNVGDAFVIKTIPVTDNNPSKTNTGKTFNTLNEVIVWGLSGTWIELGASVGVQIDDTTASLLKTYSSQKIENKISSINAGNLSVDTTNFNNNLTVNENTIQKALDKIDNMVLASGGGGGSGNATLTNVAKLGVVGSTTTPYTFTLTIPSTANMVISPTIWKYVAGTQNVVSTTADFNNSESSNFQAINNVLFDGKMHLKTSFTYAMNDDGALGSGRMFSYSLDLSDFKNVESLEVN